MAESPLWKAAEAVAMIGLPALEQYCRENPSILQTCKTCEREIASTPWWSPNGSFHESSNGWIHTETITSSCPREFPYCFAEPADG